MIRLKTLYDNLCRQAAVCGLLFFFFPEEGVGFTGLIRFLDRVFKSIGSDANKVGDSFTVKDIKVASGNRGKQTI